MAGVQFYGKDAVLDAFNNRGIETWAIFQGKNLNYAGTGSDLLEQILDKLEGGSSTYTLAVYNSGVAPDNLTNRTENNGAFNFKLDKEARAVGTTVTRAGGFSDPITNEIQNALAGEIREYIKERFTGKREPVEQSESWVDILKNTVKEDPGTIVRAIGALKDLFSPGVAAATMPAVLGSVNPAGMQMKSSEKTLHSSEGVDIDQDRWDNVLDRLEAADPDILIHLEQLAAMAEKNPGMYKTALSFLNQ